MGFGRRVGRVGRGGARERDRARELQAPQAHAREIEARRQVAWLEDDGPLESLGLQVVLAQIAQRLGDPAAHGRRARVEGRGPVERGDRVLAQAEVLLQLASPRADLGGGAGRALELQFERLAEGLQRFDGQIGGDQGLRLAAIGVGEGGGWRVVHRGADDSIPQRSSRRTCRRERAGTRSWSSGEGGE